jgi:hypothetical protein
MMDKVQKPIIVFIYSSRVFKNVQHTKPKGVQILALSADSNMELSLQVNAEQGKMGGRHGERQRWERVCQQVCLGLGGKTLLI